MKPQMSTNQEHALWIQGYRTLAAAYNRIADIAASNDWHEAWIEIDGGWFTVTIEIEDGAFDRAIFRTSDGLHVAIRWTFNDAVDTLYYAMMMMTEAA